MGLYAAWVSDCVVYADPVYSFLSGEKDLDGESVRST